jgi:signal transduction histidine kinase
MWRPEDAGALVRRLHEEENAVVERLFEEEQRARREAEVAARMRDERLAEIAHELRTPLNVILGWTQLLRQKPFEEARTTRALEVIERNARMQARLVEDLLDVSRMLNGAMQISPAAVEPLGLVERAIECVRLAAEKKSVTVALTACSGACEPISADPERLLQIVVNLLGNAVKFTPRGGSVEVRVDRTDAGVVIEVKDDGVGIEASFLPHVFERFQQAEGPMRQGLGLGLAIVRHLAELHGGRVDAGSEGLGHGATFTVTLPG